MTQKQSSQKALDLAILLLASAKDTIGPYLSVYLKANYKFDALSIGIAIASSSFFGIISQIPAGAIFDKIENIIVCVEQEKLRR